MTTLYWAIVVIGCLILGFITGRFYTKCELGKMLYTLEKNGVLIFKGDIHNGKVGE